MAFSYDPTENAREVVSICERLEHLAPELGSGRTADSAQVIAGQSMVIELLAGSAAEEILFPHEKSLGAKHDQVEAHAIARICVAAQPATKHLIQYCYAEARALIRTNIDIVEFLVAALIEFGTLDNTEIDTIIAAGMTARAVKKEHKRHDDWRERQHNAAAFLKRI